jgi:hypothetical protein
MKKSFTIKTMFTALRKYNTSIAVCYCITFRRLLRRTLVRSAMLFNTFIQQVLSNKISTRLNKEQAYNGTPIYIEVIEVLWLQYR